MNFEYEKSPEANEGNKDKTRGLGKSGERHHHNAASGELLEENILSKGTMEPRRFEEFQTSTRQGEVVEKDTGASQTSIIMRNRTRRQLRKSRDRFWRTLLKAGWNNQVIHRIWRTVDAANEKQPN